MAHPGMGVPVTGVQTTAAVVPTTTFDQGFYTWKPTTSEDLLSTFEAAPTLTLVNPKLTTDDTVLVTTSLATISTPSVKIFQTTSTSPTTTWLVVTASSSSSNRPSSSAVADSTQHSSSGLSSSAITAIVVGAIIVCLALAAVLWARRRRIKARWTAYRDGRHRKARSLLPASWGGEEGDDEKGAFVGHDDDGLSQVARGRTGVRGWGWASELNRHSEDFSAVPYANDDRYGSVSSTRLVNAGYENVGSERGWGWGASPRPTDSPGAGRRPLPMTPDLASPQPPNLDALLADSRRRYSPEELKEMAELQRRPSLLGRAGAALYSLTQARSKRYQAASLKSSTGRYNDQGQWNEDETTNLAYATTPGPRMPEKSADQSAQVTRSVRRWALTDDVPRSPTTPTRSTPYQLPPSLLAGSPQTGSQRIISPRLFYGPAQPSPQGKSGLKEVTPVSADPFGPYTAIPSPTSKKRADTSPQRRSAVAGSNYSPMGKERRRVDAFAEVGKIVKDRPNQTNMNRSNSTGSLTDLVQSLLSGDRY